MKENILKLRSENKTYTEIQSILGCSKSTISYHCGEGKKEMAHKRQKKRRINIIKTKLESFKYAKQNKNEYIINETKSKKNLLDCVSRFQRNNMGEEINQTPFTWVDVLNKFGEDTFCYLTGEKINLYKNTYQFDHILPTSRFPDNSIDNLGMLLSKVNRMKGNLTVDELLGWCVKILRHNGYTVSKDN